MGCHVLRLSNGVFLKTVALVFMRVDVGAAKILSVSESVSHRCRRLDTFLPEEAVSFCISCWFSATILEKSVTSFQYVL